MALNSNCVAKGLGWSSRRLFSLEIRWQAIHPHADGVLIVHV